MINEKIYSAGITADNLNKLPVNYSFFSINPRYDNPLIIRGGFFPTYNSRLSDCESPPKSIARLIIPFDDETERKI